MIFINKKGTFVLWLLLGLSAFCQSYAQEAISRSQLTFYVHNTDNHSDSLLARSATDIALHVQKYMIQKNDRIEFLLSNEGIFPLDKDIYTLLYEWNPSIRSLSALTPGTVMRLPSFSRPTGRMLEGKLLLFHLDDSIRAGIASDCRALADTSLKGKNPHFEEPISTLQLINAALTERTQSISHERLLDIKAESAQLLSLQHRNAQDTLFVNTQLSLIAADLKKWGTGFVDKKSPGGIPDNYAGKVQVAVRRSKSHQALPEYRIFYCAPSQKGIFFHTVTTVSPVPVIGSVDEGGWLFWVRKAESGDPYPSDSEVVPVNVTAGSTTKVDIYLLHGK